MADFDNEQSPQAEIVLASASPRRRDLLQALGWKLHIHPADIIEEVDPGESALQFVKRMAQEKAQAARVSLSSIPELNQLPILAADTVVEFDGEILGKAAGLKEAAAVLKRLSGQWHSVHSAFCFHKPNQIVAAQVTSEVLFRKLCKREIEAYLESGEYADKAGSYGVQGLGGALVQEVRGSYSNVIGLPIAELIEAYAKIE